MTHRRQAMQLERERQRQEKEQHVQMLYMQKMAGEADRRREAETRMSDLEREERDLISRLRKTQEMQEKASTVNAYACLTLTLCFTLTVILILPLSCMNNFPPQAYAALQKSLRS